MKPEISAFFPAYNEEGNLARMVCDLRRVLSETASRYEIIIVDDGSRDATAALAQELSRRHPEVRLVRHPVNRGYGAAVRSGIEACRYPVIFFTDGDCQFDVSEVRKLLPHLRGHDIVSGYRARRQDPLVRRLYSRGWNWLIRTLLGVETRDLNCAFKLFNAAMFEHFPLRADGALINAEIMYHARLHGRTHVDIPVSHFPRRSGSPTGGDPRVILRAFWELLSLWGSAHAHHVAPARRRQSLELVAGAAKTH